MCDNGVKIILTFDICSDLENVRESVNYICHFLKKEEDYLCKNIRCTWFVRCDNQLESLYGDSAYLFKKYDDIWNGLVKMGHEIGWHPHIYYFDGSAWKLETRDKELAAQLISSYQKLPGHLNIKAVRMGESFHSNHSMFVLDKLGLRLDSSAIPGRKRDDDRKFDWIGTPKHPYKPSIFDYRAPGEKSLEILEVPMSVLPIKTDYLKQPLDRYINLSFFHDSIKDGLDNTIKTSCLLVVITHPFELIRTNFVKNSLISYDIGEASKNLRYIADSCIKYNKPFEFVTISELLNEGV